MLDFLNERHRRLLSLPGLQHLREKDATLASVADQALYGLASVAKVNGIVDLTNRRPLDPMTMAQYRSLQPDASIILFTDQHDTAIREAARRWPALVVLLQQHDPDLLLRYARSGVARARLRGSSRRLGQLLAGPANRSERP